MTVAEALRGQNGRHCAWPQSLRIAGAHG